MQMNGKKAKSYCEESLELDPESFYGLLYRAKSSLENEDFEVSVELLNKASQVRPDKQDIVNPLLRKAQIALQRSKTKDYYKVLGIASDADERQIKSAYRKLCKVHHPDKAVRQGLTKEQAEKKMAEINEAYEVLSDPELRARFDRGDDPNAQGQQNPFHGSPFGGGGQPFMFQQGGSGGQFQFQFSGGGFPF
jgi:DnaJ homolog subfamily C member 3